MSLVLIDGTGVFDSSERGFIFAALAGAVVSSLASMLNSASTIFTMDLFVRHFKKDASAGMQVAVGRTMTLVFVVIGCTIAPYIDDPRFRGVFHYIQDFQGYVSPGILACFLFGLFVRKAPAAAAIAGMLLNIPVYGLLHLSPSFLESVGLGGKAAWLDWLAIQAEGTCFLNKMAITFAVLVLVMAIITRLWPLRRPIEIPVREAFDTRPAPLVLWLGVAIVAVVIGLYVALW